MSGIGEAASIAGLITISGQCVKQVSNLYSFVREYQNVVPQTTTLLDELHSLRQCLSHIESVTSRARAVHSGNLSSSVDALFSALGQSLRTITAIERELRELLPGKKKQILKRVKATAARDFFARFHAQVSAQKQDLLLRFHTLSCDLDLHTHNDMELLTASSGRTERKLCDVTQSLDRHHALSRRHLQCLDARLETIQKMLAQSTSTNHRSKPNPRTKAAKSRYSTHTYPRVKALKSLDTQTSSLGPAIQHLRVVSPALLTYEKLGLLQKEVIPLVCSEFNGSNDAIKIQMISYLQGLRLLIWLLRHNTSFTTNASELGITGRSSFAIQAGMASSWELSTALQGLCSGIEVKILSEAIGVWTLSDASVVLKSDSSPSMPPIVWRRPTGSWWRPTGIWFKHPVFSSMRVIIGSTEHAQQSHQTLTVILPEVFMKVFMVESASSEFLGNNFSEGLINPSLYSLDTVTLWATGDARSG